MGSFLMKDCISRRAFLKTAVGAGTCLYGLNYLSSLPRAKPLKELKETGLKKGLVVVHGDRRDGRTEEETIREMTLKALKSLGGIEQLISRGDRVVIKPNISWNRTPEFAANTNPFLIAALVELCRGAGASRVKVLDNTCSSNPTTSYELSGVARAAGKAGAEVCFVNPSRLREVSIPKGKALSSWAFFDDFILKGEVDVLINVPVAKHHSTSRLTMALKNVMGMVGWDRGALHKDIHPKIADLNRVVKVDLTVLDAYRILKNHGPTGGRLEDVDNSPEGARRIVVSTDPVAVDSYGATLFGLRPEDIGFLREAHGAGLGEVDFGVYGVEELTV
jgi:uncharacterized protein (DUF362 family)